MAAKKKRKVRVKVRGYEPDDAAAVAKILGSRGVVEETMQPERVSLLLFNKGDV